MARLSVLPPLRLHLLVPKTLDFRELVRHLQTEGRTILLTTHDMAEAESVCDRVALIDRGRLLAVETPRTLSQWVARYDRVDFECSVAHVAERLRALPGVASVTQSTSVGYRVELLEESAIHRALRFLVDAGVTVVSTSRPSLEEVYVRFDRRKRRTSRTPLTHGFRDPGQFGSGTILFEDQEPNARVGALAREFVDARWHAPAIPPRKSPRVY